MSVWTGIILLYVDYIVKFSLRFLFLSLSHSPVPWVLGKQCSQDGFKVPAPASLRYM
jgi:hypothetical protein